MTGDRPLLGILLMLGFCILAPLGDGTAKVLGARIPLAELLAVRFAVQAAILLPLVWAAGTTLALPARALRLVAVRTALHVAGIGCMFAALRHLPLADAVAIAFVMPFIMLFLGWLVLGEQVGARRIGAAAVGFAGTMMVVQPSFAEVGAPALLPLAVAVIFALFMLVTRQLARVADPVVLQALGGVMGTAALAPALALGWAAGLFQPVMPGGVDWALLALLGALGTAAHLVMTWSLRYAPTATLAPMQYLEIPFAAAIGWLIFGDFPNGLALAGIVVTVSAGLYIVLREGRLSRSSAPPAPAPAPPAAE